MSDIKLSVVIPLFNKVETIEASLHAVLRQDASVDEIIVIDDGSTDRSAEIVEKLARLYPQNELRLIRQGNSGVSAARNRGVSLARNEFVCLLDADDVWSTDFTKKMTALINDYPAADLFCLGHQVVRGSLIAAKPRHGCADGFRGYVKNFFMASQYGSVAKSSKICVRKAALQGIGGFPEGVVAGEDLYVWIKMALQGRVACDPVVACTVYQMDDDSRHSRRHSVPYPVKYYSSKCFKKELDFHSRNYIASIAFKHVVSAFLGKNYTLAFKRWNAMRRFSLIRSILPFYLLYMFVRLS